MQSCTRVRLQCDDMFGRKIISRMNIKVDDGCVAGCRYGATSAEGDLVRN